jgi:hypothetical protein
MTMTSILRKPLIHVVVGMGRVIQVIKHPRRALLMVPHECGEEAGLWWLRLLFQQDDLKRLKGLML